MTWFVAAIALWIFLLLICWVWVDGSIETEERARTDTQRHEDRSPAHPKSYRRDKGHARTKRDN